MIFTVTSVASWCCRILFLMGGLHLPHWKAPCLCTPNTNVCPHNSVYQMYLSRKGTLGTIPVYNGTNGRITQTHLLKVEWQGTQHRPRVKLLEWPFVHSCLASKKQGVCITQTFILGGTWQMTYAQAYTTCQKFQVMHFTSPPNNVGLQLWTDVVQQAQTALHRNFGRITKPNGLDYAYTGEERSVMIDRGILPLHIYHQRFHVSIKHFF